VDIGEHPSSEPDHERRAQALARLRTQLAYTRKPAYQAEVSRQAALLAGTPEEEEALDFRESAFLDLAKDLGDE